MKVIMAIEYYCNNAIAKNLAESTIQLYKRELEAFNGTLTSMGVEELDMVRSFHIDAYFSEMIKKGNSANTRSRKKSILDSFFKFCITHELLEKNHMSKIPTIKVTDFDRKAQEVLTQKELMRLIASTPSEKSNLKKRLMIKLLSYCGLRVSELRILTADDFDFNENIIKVKGKGRKLRNVTLFDEIAIDLKEYLKHCDTKYLFEGYVKDEPMTSRAILKMVKSTVEKSGIKKNIGCHSLRRTAATNLLRQGVNVRYIQIFLGHNDISTTMRYLNPEEQEMNKEIQDAFKKISSSTNRRSKKKR